MENSFNIQMEQFSKELKLLLFFMQNNVEDKKLSDELLKDINWDIFLQLSLHHRVFPIIYLKLKNLNSKFIPEHVVQSLFHSYQKNVFRMLHFSGETESISKVFDDNNIRTLFLKGPVLAVDLYGDLSLRTSADLDVLIPFDKLNLAEDILINQGYIKDEYIITVLNDWKWRHHHFTFYHPIKKIKVEIHWRLNPGPSKEPNFEELWSRKKVSKLTSYPIYTLGKEDLFQFLISHGARHGWSRLRWLMDINKIVEKGLDLPFTIKLLRKNQYLHVAGQTLVLLDRLFLTRVPEEIQYLLNRKQTEQLALDALFYIKQMVNLHTEPVPEEVAKYHKKHLFSLMSRRQKFYFTLSFLYPYPEDAEFFPLPKKLHILYFPLRPFLLILRKMKDRKVTRRA